MVSRYLWLVLSIFFLSYSPSWAILITFDARIDGTPISANASFGATSPGSPLPGPHLTEYSSLGVIFDGGVTLNYNLFGGPLDPRTSTGSILGSAPNLLATADLFALRNGDILPGSITASFASRPALFVNTLLRNGVFAPRTFTLTSFSDGRVVATQTVSLASFLSPGQDGVLSVSGPGIDRVTISSSGPGRDFGIDNFEFELKPEVLLRIADVYESVARVRSVVTWGRIGLTSSAAVLIASGIFSPFAVPAAVPLFQQEAIDASVAILDGIIRGLVLDLARDPFDPDYPTVFEPQQFRLGPVTPNALFDTAIAQALGKFQENTLDTYSALQALHVSLERFVSAVTAGDQASAERQLGAVERYLQLVREASLLAAAAAEPLAPLIEALDILIAPEDILTFQNSLALLGFPEEEWQVFRLLGLTSEQIEEARTQLLATSPPTTPTDLSEMFRQERSYYVSVAQSVSVPEPPAAVLYLAGLIILGLGVGILDRTRSPAPPCQKTAHNLR